MSENKEVNKLKVDDLEIIVTGKKDKPLYQIQYHEVGNEPNHYDIGFGSYILGNVFEWKEEYFEIIPKDETKQEVTNERIMKHLNEIELAIGCTLNGMSALFSLIHSRKDELELDRTEEEMFREGIVAMLVNVKRMREYSGVEERIKKMGEADAHVEVHEIKDVGDLLDFMKEILK